MSSRVLRKLQGGADELDDVSTSTTDVVDEDLHVSRGAKPKKNHLNPFDLVSGSLYFVLVILL